MRDTTHNPLGLAWITAARQVVRGWVKPPAAEALQSASGHGKYFSALGVMALLLMPMGLVAQVVYTYEDVPIVADQPIDDNSCSTPGGGRVRTINVPETFNVGATGTIALGVVITHPNRDQIRIELTAPNGNTVVLADGTATDAFDNYNITFSNNHDGNGGGPLSDGDNDPASVANGTAFYRRLVNANTINTTLFPTVGSPFGDWTLRICDDQTTATDNTGTYLRARLTDRKSVV